MVKRLAIIPARAGSQRIKNKNMKKFFKKPLISYTLSAAKKSKLFDVIHVSTNSKKISNHAKKFNLEPGFLRPKYLSGNIIGLHEVLKYVVARFRKINQNSDEVWLLYSTNPFINKNILRNCKKAFDKINNNPKNSLMTVTNYNYPLQWAQSINRNDQLIPIFKNNFKIQSQDKKKLVCDAGMINIYSGDLFTSNLKRKYFAYKLPIYLSVDIDDLNDFKLAMRLFKKK
jgi:pseudaminic acid cytidylyltransferase